VSEWEPATDAEVAMRDALRTDDQESYFRILAGVDLLLPVSADALAGLAPLGWGTWSTGGRTHVLAFTSPSALQACLADYTGSARRVAYGELANTWPNLEWWLAVNPGLPIEGYLPAWFVAQLSRGDLRLPTRGPARDASAQPGKKLQDLQAAALAANAAAAGYPGGQGGPTGPGGPVGYPGEAAAAAGAGPAAGQNSGYGSSASGYAQGAGYGTSPGSAPFAAGPGGFGQQPSAGEPAPGAGVGPRPGESTPTPAAGVPAASSFSPDSGDRGSGGSGFAQGPGPGQVGPGGLPIRTPGAVLPSGLPSRIPAGSQPPQGAGSSPGGSGVPAAYRPPGVPGGPPGIPGDAQSGSQRPGSGGAAAAFGSPPSGSPGGQGSTSSAPGTSQSTLGSASGAATSGSPRIPGAAAAFGSRGTGSAAGGPTQGATGPGMGGSSVSSAGGSAAAGAGVGGQRGQTGPGPGGPGIGGGAGLAGSGASSTGGQSMSGPGSGASGIGGQSVSGPGSGPSGGGQSATSPAQPGLRTNLPPLQDPRAPLPARTPMAQTPPVPGHLTPGEASSAPSSPAPVEQQPPPASFGGALPRRQVTPPAERPPSMAAAAQALAGTRSPQPTQPRTPDAPTGGEPTRPGLVPPVIPGAAGTGRPGVTSFAPGTPAQPPPVQPPPAAAPPTDEDFVPANAVEQDLYYAAGGGSTDAFLSTLLLATVLVPVANNSRPGSAPGESGFAFRTEELDGERYLIVFTSRDRLAEHFAEPTRTVGVRFLELIRNWPDPAWSFAVNPNTPVGAKYPGPQVIALANWATESGLGADPAEAPAAIEATPAAVPPPQRATDSAQHATVMQKTVPVDQVDYFLERGYDRVAGFVHRASEVEHLRTPGELFGALGLVYDGSPYQADAKEAFVLRWPAYRPSLYRIPYGGQSEQALRAMDGWVIERPPFRGNGFAPGEGRDVIAEFKVDSVRLPHGAQLWRMDGDGGERMIAVLDSDAPLWRRVGEQ